MNFSDDGMEENTKGTNPLERQAAREIHDRQDHPNFCNSSLSSGFP